jgi:serine/threonine protein phosphatase PrpC
MNHCSKNIIEKVMTLTYSPPMNVMSFQYTLTGRREINEDSASFLQPSQKNALDFKGSIAIIGDGTGGTGEGQFASQFLVNTLIGDYYRTPDSCSIERSVKTCMEAINRQLFQRGIQNEKNHITTASVVVLRGRKLHLFHVGDSRVYRWHLGKLKRLTEDHHLPGNKSILTRALGMDKQLSLDYQVETIDIGELILFVSDGIHGALSQETIADLLSTKSPKDLPQTLCEQALNSSHGDNATCLLLQIIDLPAEHRAQVDERSIDLKFPPFLRAGEEFENFLIHKEIFSGGMGSVYLVSDLKNRQQYALKCPHPDLADNPIFKERFLREEWVGQRVHSPFLMKSYSRNLEETQYLYLLLEYCPGGNLRQLMMNGQKFKIDEVLAIARQVTQGLNFLNNLGIIHRDIKPDNIVLSTEGQVKIVDYGIVYIPELNELNPSEDLDRMMGSPSYMAPELALNTCGHASTDVFAFGVMLYELLSGQLPYGLIHHPDQYQGRQYLPLGDLRPDCPDWLDHLIRSMVQQKPEDRLGAASEVLYFLDHPGSILSNQPQRKLSLLEKNPTQFWRATTLISLIINLILLGLLAAHI